MRAHTPRPLTTPQTLPLLLALASALTACAPKIEPKQLQGVIAKGVSEQLKLDEEAAQAVEVQCPEKISGDAGAEVTCAVLIPAPIAVKAQRALLAAASAPKPASEQCGAPQPACDGSTPPADPTAADEALRADWSARAAQIITADEHPLTRLQRLGSLQRQRAEVKVKVTAIGQVTWSLHGVTAAGAITP